MLTITQSVFTLYFCSQQMPYYVHIARFMPHVEIVQNHSSTVRRLFIRGDNGKVNKLYAHKLQVADKIYTLGVPISCGQ